MVKPTKGRTNSKSISKIFKFVDNAGKDRMLTLLEKKFCEFYLEFDGCGADAYEEAGYTCKNRSVAISGAHNTLIKEDVSAYINKLLSDQGFEDRNVSKQHLFLINQHADLSSKSRGIDMFYKLSGKYAAEKVKIIDENEHITDEELEDERNRLEAEKHRREQYNKKKGKPTKILHT